MIIFENEVGHVYINLIHIIWKRPKDGTKKTSGLQRPCPPPSPPPTKIPAKNWSLKSRALDR